VSGTDTIAECTDSGVAAIASAITGTDTIAECTDTGEVLLQSIEVVTRSVIADENLTEHLATADVTHVAIGAGGGGLAASGAGGGGGSAVQTIAGSVTPHVIAIGAGGAGANVGGTATAGGTTTVNTTTCVAPGGSPATLGGGGGAGGTGGTGTTLFAGGAGTSSATNSTSGGSGGSTGAGSGATGGAVEGACGILGSVTPLPTFGAGGPSTATVGTSGYSGINHVTYSRLVTRRVRRAGAARTRDITNATSRTLAKGGTYASGDVLLALCAIDGNGGSASMASPWIELADTGTGACVAAFVADDDDALDMTLTTGSETCNSFVFRIKGAKAASNWDVTTAAAAANADPPEHTHAGGSQPILWYCAIALDGNTSALSRIVSPPSNATSGFVITPWRTSSNGFTQIAVAWAFTASGAAFDFGSWTNPSGSGGMVVGAIPQL